MKSALKKDSEPVAVQDKRIICADSRKGGIIVEGIIFTRKRGFSVENDAFKSITLKIPLMDAVPRRKEHQNSHSRLGDKR